ncbi:FMN-binding glutamate synthase family protein [Comamonas terrigena]|jgi:glutamate synthase domain-containing protein 2|uniref:FMN-binding glutamate synthase family protein n=1 Tax=Comamonas terrigena TaxID=32013 RepID=UPI00244A7E9E|nr:FMN-binding glutamate synthase family protein [Comamonas terrigena]MDH0050692.1 FMN-binding glutamate synthase family protein [Comamonas terrigena]MDH0513148.1 FMN-binding glutamate synthase family protein [Comamonas terrigena]MDH1092524.1 FMN-binding glutamate synthase family protein [Comamonas terrigena]
MVAAATRSGGLFPIRYTALVLCALGGALCLAAALLWQRWWWWLAAALLLALALVGWFDLRQTRHAILRNYPIIGHLRFLFESIRPEMRQYFIESDNENLPFSRAQRSLVYQRSKGQPDSRPFGTQLDVSANGYEWVNHSLQPSTLASHDFRTWIGGVPGQPHEGVAPCTQPYQASVFNISAMSFGALSANAILALNQGARTGGFAHDTGEGSISQHHRVHGGDLIWEIGSGYFGCRNADGSFSAERFTANALDPQVKMIELKLSQGAKPGHGGMLLGAKVTAEIAAARGVPEGEDCISPSSHSAFTTPLEMLQFIARLRQLSGGKPVGFKFCVGHPWEWFAIVKAMQQTDITPDFIVVDGAEGGTGAAPVEFTDHVGVPLQEGLLLVHNTLVGVNLRHRIRLGAAGKVITAFDIARMMSLGADWCNCGRGFMMALGCIQAQTCHTGRCPTGVTTQDARRQQALVVPDKATRVANYHRQTLHALMELVQAAGLQHPRDFTPHHIVRRTGDSQVHLLSNVVLHVQPGALLGPLDGQHNVFQIYWPRACAESFHIAPPPMMPSAERPQNVPQA